MSNEYTTQGIVYIDPCHIEVSSKAFNGCIQEPEELSITSVKNTYSIVGDALFASVSVDEAPEWLTSIIDSVIDTQLKVSLDSLDELKLSILEALSEIDIAKNQYQELINIEVTIDGIITSKLETLNANVANADAKIIDLEFTKASKDEAVAIAIEQIGSSINSPNGEINALVTGIRGTIATLDDNTRLALEGLDLKIDGTSGALAFDILELTAIMADVNSQITNLQAASVTEDRATAIASSVLLASLNTPNGLLSSEFSSVRQTLTALDGNIVALDSSLTDQFDGKLLVVSNSVTTLEAHTDTELGKIRLELETGITDAGDVFAQQLEDLEVSTAAATAAVETRTRAYVDSENTATTLLVTNLRTETEASIGLINTTLGTTVDDVGNISTKYGVVLTAGGKDPSGANSPLVGGFEMLNDSNSVVAGFDVDNFWVGRLNLNGVRPFQVIDNDVFIDTAIIREASITNAMIDNLSADKITAGDIDVVLGIGSGVLIDGETGTVTTVADGGNKATLGKHTVGGAEYTFSATSGPNVLFGLGTDGIARLGSTLEIRPNVLTVGNSSAWFSPGVQIGRYSGLPVLYAGNGASNFIKYSNNVLSINTPNFSVSEAGDATFGGNLQVGTKANGVPLFYTSGGTTYIQSAVIQDASISFAKVSNNVRSVGFSELNPNGWMLDSITGNATFNNVKARGDIEASSLKADMVVTNSIRSGDFDVDNPTTSQGWGIYEDGRAFFASPVISRPNVLYDGVLDIPTPSGSSGWHYNFSNTRLVSNDGNGRTWGAFVVGSTIGVSYTSTNEWFYTIDVPESVIPNQNSWAANGPILSVSCVITAITVNTSDGNDPPARSLKISCYGYVERVADYESNALMRIVIIIPPGSTTYNGLRRIHVNRIEWALHGIT